MRITCNVAAITDIYNLNWSILPTVCGAMGIHSLINKVDQKLVGGCMLELLVHFTPTDDGLQAAAKMLGEEIRDLQCSKLRFMAHGIKYSQRRSFKKVFREMCTDMLVLLDIQGDCGTLSVRIIHD